MGRHPIFALPVPEGMPLSTTGEVGLFQGALHEIVCVRQMKQILEFLCIANGALGRIVRREVEGLGQSGDRSEWPFAPKALYESALAPEASGADS
jgi:hypothetical protein